LATKLGAAAPVMAAGGGPAAAAGAATAEQSEKAAAAEAPRCTADGPQHNCRKTVVLVGIPVEVAKQRARDAGFVGEIGVFEADHEASCAQGAVCRIDPSYWQIDGDGDLKLYVNRKVAIAAPR
jgi:hypothetical protein